MKGRPHARIGFRDQWLMACMIPVLAFVIPIVFMGVRFHGPVPYRWEFYVQSLFFTVVMWIGNRFIMVWARNKYPDFSLVRKRLIVQSLVMLAYTFLATTALSILLIDFCAQAFRQLPRPSNGDILIGANSASIFCTLTITAIYESRYFMSELKKSVEEKELLKRESLNAQLDALRTQISPHFLFNNLNTLVAIIPEEPETAVQFVQQLSKIYRHILEVKDEPCISLKQELNVLHAYAFLLQTRFGKNLDIQVDIPETVLSQQIVPLSLHMLMENAIKHNIVSEDHPLHIHIYAKNGQLVVSNNLQLKKQVSESIGMGLKNISERCKLLTDKLIEVISGPDQFIVSIPLIQK